MNLRRQYGGHQLRIEMETGTVKRKLTQNTSTVAGKTTPPRDLIQHVVPPQPSRYSRSRLRIGPSFIRCTGSCRSFRSCCSGTSGRGSHLGRGRVRKGFCLGTNGRGVGDGGSSRSGSGGGGGERADGGGGCSWREGFSESFTEPPESSCS